MAEIHDEYLDTCERRVRQIERLAGDTGMTRPVLDLLSIEFFGQEPYKLPLEHLESLLTLVQEIADAVA